MHAHARTRHSHAAAGAHPDGREFAHDEQVSDEGHAVDVQEQQVGAEPGDLRAARGQRGAQWCARPCGTPTPMCTPTPTRNGVHAHVARAFARHPRRPATRATRLTFCRSARLSTLSTRTPPNAVMGVYRNAAGTCARMCQPRVCACQPAVPGRAGQGCHWLLLWQAMGSRVCQPCTCACRSAIAAKCALALSMTYAAHSHAANAPKDAEPSLLRGQGRTGQGNMEGGKMSMLATAAATPATPRHAPQPCQHRPRAASVACALGLPPGDGALGAGGRGHLVDHAISSSWLHVGWEWGLSAPQASRSGRAAARSRFP